MLKLFFHGSFMYIPAQKSQYNRVEMSNKTLIIEALQQKVETLRLTLWDDFLFST